MPRDTLGWLCDCSPGHLAASTRALVPISGDCSGLCLSTRSSPSWGLQPCLRLRGQIPSRPLGDRRTPVLSQPELSSQGHLPTVAHSESQLSSRWSLGPQGSSVNVWVPRASPLRHRLCVFTLGGSPGSLSELSSCLTSSLMWGKVS